MSPGPARRTVGRAQRPPPACRAGGPPRSTRVRSCARVSTVAVQNVKHFSNTPLAVVVAVTLGQGPDEPFAFARREAATQFDFVIAELYLYWFVDAFRHPLLGHKWQIVGGPDRLQTIFIRKVEVRGARLFAGPGRIGLRLGTTALSIKEHAKERSR